jgi:hypothetical protein
LIDLSEACIHLLNVGRKLTFRAMRPAGASVIAFLAQLCMPFVPLPLDDPSQVPFPLMDEFGEELRYLSTFFCTFGIKGAMNNQPMGRVSPLAFTYVQSALI